MNKVARLVTLSVLLSLAVWLPGAARAQNPQHHHPAGPPAGTPVGARPVVPAGTRPMMPAGRTLTTPPVISSPSKEMVKNASGEEFFIIAAIDKQNSQILLKEPTEVTVLVKLAPNTKYFGDNGKATTINSFRAGDTVWAKLSGDAPGATLLQMREGEMTVADLHRYFLDYPVIKLH